MLTNYNEGKYLLNISMIVLSNVKISNHYKQVISLHLILIDFQHYLFFYLHDHLHKPKII